MKRILVIGSVSTDFVVTTDQKPNQGETVFGKNFEISFGGKGANQAVAASRLGADVGMIGLVGDDIFGKEIIENLNKNRVNTDNVEPVPHEVSGSAHIILYEKDNSIIVVPGANNQLDKTKIENLRDNIKQYDLVIIQNEIPQLTNEKIIQICWEEKIPTIYNPAPARKLAKEWIEKVTYLTPNEHEFTILFPDKKFSEALREYPNQLIITLGSKGSVFFDGEKEIHIPAFKVEPIDTTGAGDTFNGAMAVGLINGMTLEESLKLANLSAAYSVKKFGAQGGMPTLNQLKGSSNYEKEWYIK